MLLNHTFCLRIHNYRGHFDRRGACTCKSLYVISIFIPFSQAFGVVYFSQVIVIVYFWMLNVKWQIWSYGSHMVSHWIIFKLTPPCPIAKEENRVVSFNHFFSLLRDDVIKWKHFPRYWPGNSPVTGELPLQRPVTRNFDVFFDLCLSKRLNKQSWDWWFETPARSLWRYCNGWPTRCYDNLCPAVTTELALLWATRRIPRCFLDVQ